MAVAVTAVVAVATAEVVVAAVTAVVAVATAEVVAMAAAGATAEVVALAGMAAASVVAVAVAAAGMPCAVMAAVAAMPCAVTVAAAAMPCAVTVAASECVVAGGRVRASVMAVLTVRLMRVADSSVAITSIVEGQVIGIEGTDGGGDTAGLWLRESALQPRARITALVGDGTVGSG